MFAPVSLTNLLLRCRRMLVIVIHMLLIIAANFLAFELRFDGVITGETHRLWLGTFPWLLAIRGLTFIPFRLYQGLWRYTGVWDLRDIIVAVSVSSLLFYGFAYWALGTTGYPRSILIIDSLVLIVLMGGIRLARRLYQGIMANTPHKRVLIYGAGDIGEAVVRDIRNSRDEFDYDPVGFVDDDRRKIGRRIHGVPVLGSGDDLGEIMLKEKPDEVLLAIPGAQPATLRKLVSTLAPFKVAIRTLPGLSNGGGNGARMREIRNLAIEDLLERLPIGLDTAPLKHFLKGRRIVVTGAGGSIGSELCRQIAACEPEILILLDKSESALYSIDMELAQRFPTVNKVPVLLDVKNVTPLQELFQSKRPQVVFHAAAYKHVPMMEAHPGEAVLNNIVGTKRLCEVSIQNKVERFILISTDKAVNPTNIMGATKRACEILVQALSKSGGRAQTAFSAVRFGNVLGSSGSVVPLFREQIEKGGPVTVTHPDISRYFMTIPEAVQLVLHAATLATGGEIFVLEMGEQVKLLDMARNLIRISGFIPEEEVPITFIGLRPGEKLREELLGMDETVSASAVDKIMRVQSGWVPSLDVLSRTIVDLERLAIKGYPEEVIKLLFEIVPTFRPLNPSTSLQIVHNADREEESAKLALVNRSIVAK